MYAVTHDSRLRFLAALGCWSAALLALLRSPLGQQAIVAPFTAWHAVFASGFAGGSPVIVDLSCSGSDVIALSIAALLAYPVAWRRRLSGVVIAVIWLSCLNLLRVITLVKTAGSPLFLPLHMYIWPATMIGGSAAFVGGWIWTGQRAAPGRLLEDFARKRRLVAATGVLVVGYIAVMPWLQASTTLQRAAMTLAQAAAALLRAVGQPALSGGGTLVVADRGFLVTPECIVTPLMPIYLGWALIWPRDRRTRIGALVLFAPLFAALGFLRLLTVALPAIIGPPLFLTHGFYQFLVAVILLTGAARWRAQPAFAPREPARAAARQAVSPASVVRRLAKAVSPKLVPFMRAEADTPLVARNSDEVRTTAGAMAAAFLTAIVVGVLLAAPYTSLIELAAQAIAPAPTATFSVGTAPTPDVQGALAIMPGFELALLCGLAVALWGRRSVRVLAALVPVAAVLQVATLIVAGHLSVRFGAEVPVTFVRAVSILTPCLLVAAALVRRLPALPRHPVVTSRPSAPRESSARRPQVAEVRSPRDTSRERGLTVGRLLITYLAVTEALHVLWTGRFDVGPEAMVKAIAVPAVQTAVLEVVGVLVRTTRASVAIDGLARFFGRWLMLSVTFAAATMTIDLLGFGRADLTAAMWLTLLVTPAIQAAAFGDAVGRAPLTLVWQTVRRHRLATPVLLLDAVMLLAGWGLASHALVGLSEASILQRRWIGTKLLAAAVVYSLCPPRDHQTVHPGRNRRLLLGLGLTLAGIAMGLLSPPTLADAAWWLSTVTRQPPPILLLELYAASLLIVSVLALALRNTVVDRSVVAHDLIGWAAIALLVAALALLMNGFSSTQAVPPWAGLAATGGSVAATFFLIGALVLAGRQQSVDVAATTQGRDAPRGVEAGVPDLPPYS